MELFELKTVEDDMVAEVSVSGMPESKQRRASIQDEETPSPSKVSKRKMLDLSYIRNYN